MLKKIYKNNYLDNLLTFLNITVILIIIILLCTFSSSAQREFIDMMGRKVIISDQVERIVTTYKPATQFVLSLQAGDRLKAVPIQTEKQQLFMKLNPELAELPQVGSRRNGVNIETIVSVNPDLVILYPHRDSLDTAEKLELQGIQSIIINPESLTKIRETTNLLASILNKEEQGEKIINAYDRIETLTARSSQIKTEEKKQIYFANSELMSSVGADMMQTSLIENAGAVNPAADLKSGFLNISAERLIGWNPDLIIVSQFFNENLVEISGDPKFQSLKAFKNGDVYRFPSQLEPWDFPSPSSYIAQLWLAVKTYPEKYDDLDYEAEVEQFYKSLYEKSFSTLGGEF
ncbi:ABC transporter substrate-binding protein [Halanaerobium hydrogeniformans]|uniref:Periplasmic binding protein n=1 Tax=Halanaerobium hydrogeniformans TaxID=656519 RepID=E4RKC8_HALHG|nr:ABC transporter substrate-binding protein [Halanaerobium hydrogeniformans]ADQ15641.1 periplasmic binding protein [Halanaerobium hydrogeniformans]